MYIQGMAIQTQIFLLSIGFGFFTGFVFEIIKSVRKVFTESKRAIFIQDILSFLIFTVLIFLFLLCVCSGEIRLYTLFGLLCGYLIYYFTLGYILCLLFDKAVNFLKKLIKNKK